MQGTSVHVVAKPSECFSLVKPAAEFRSGRARPHPKLAHLPSRPEGVYVVQPHIKERLLAARLGNWRARCQDPLLTDDGRKCHIKVRAFQASWAFG